MKLTAEGVPVLMHDEHLERTTSGHGAVANTRFAALRQLDAGAWFGEAFAGERVPTYEEAAALCRALGLWANVEIKPCPGREAETGHSVARESMRVWAGYALPPLLSSFSVEALAAAQATAPLLPRGLLVEAPPDDWPAALASLGVCCPARRAQPGNPRTGRRSPRCRLRTPLLHRQRARPRRPALLARGRLHRHRPAGPVRPGYALKPKQVQTAHRQGRKGRQGKAQPGTCGGTARSPGIELSESARQPAHVRRIELGLLVPLGVLASLASLASLAVRAGLRLRLSPCPTARSTPAPRPRR